MVWRFPSPSCSLSHKSSRCLGSGVPAPRQAERRDPDGQEPDDGAGDGAGVELDGAAEHHEEEERQVGDADANGAQRQPRPRLGGVQDPSGDEEAHEAVAADVSYKVLEEGLGENKCVKHISNDKTAAEHTMIAALWFTSLDTAYEPWGTLAPPVRKCITPLMPLLDEGKISCNKFVPKSTKAKRAPLRHDTGAFSGDPQVQNRP